MTRCRKCSAKAQLFLCNDCIAQLGEHLTELAWLVEELDITATRQDRLTTGSVGESSDNPSPINVGAMELARTARNSITTWVRDICEQYGRQFYAPKVVRLDFIGPLPADWRRERHPYKPTTADAADWLAVHVTTIANDPGAARCMIEMEQLREEILRTINRSDRKIVGPCTTIVRIFGHKAVECGCILFASSEDVTVTCPKCKQPADVQRTRQNTWRRFSGELDKRTEREILSILTRAGKHVPPYLFRRWVNDRKILHLGWRHRGQFVNTWIQRGDPKVFSLREVLHVRDQELASGGWVPEGT